MKITALAITIFLTYCDSCFAATQAELLEGLQPVKSSKFLHIKKPIRITTEPPNKVMGGSGVVTGLAVGLYVAAEENTHGTFYKGPGRSVVYGNGQINFIQAGGLWVPKGSDVKKLKLYIYMGPENQRQYPDLPSAYAAQHEPVSASQDIANTASSAVDQSVVNTVAVNTVITTPAISPIQAGIAGGIASALIAIVDAETIKRNRGKARFLGVAPEIDYETIKEQIEFKEQSP